MFILGGFALSFIWQDAFPPRRCSMGKLICVISYSHPAGQDVEYHGANFFVAIIHLTPKKSVNDAVADEVDGIVLVDQILLVSFLPNHTLLVEICTRSPMSLVSSSSNLAGKDYLSPSPLRNLPARSTELSRDVSEKVWLRVSPNVSHSSPQVASLADVHHLVANKYRVYTWIVGKLLCQSSSTRKLTATFGRRVISSCSASAINSATCP